jgi:citrate lyase subunit beta/citryl-CoA lyase
MIPHRSLLYLPASRPEMLAKLSAQSADLVCVDLEDGVAPGEKERARAHLRAAPPAAGRPWMLRINPPRTPWHYDDMDLAAELRPPLTLLPKAESPEAVVGLARHCGGWDGRVALMIETARGVAAAGELAGTHPAVEMLVLGSADLRRSLGARPGSGRGWELLAMQRLLLAARGHGCAAIDSVFFRFKDESGLREHAGVARDLGYDGKSCIHPAQVEPIHEIFASGAEEVAWAESVLQAWDEQDGRGRGVVVVEGEMIEALHLQIARRILDRKP